MNSLKILPIISMAGSVLYFFIAAQGAFYLLGFGKALYNISPGHFIELRRAVDPIIGRRMKALYLATLMIMSLWVLLANQSEGFPGYGMVLTALLCLLTDLTLGIKASEPINKIITKETSPEFEQAYELQRDWILFVQIRGCVSVAGFLMLILHAVIA
jgi:hypothetical protein